MAAVKLKWIPIVTDKAFNSIEIGEAILKTEKEMMGKTVSVSLMELTRDIRKQSTNIKFEIRKVHDKKAIASPISMTMMPASLKRLVRRRRSKISDSFKCKTKDGYIVKLKPFLITRCITSRPVTEALRKTQRYLLSKILEKITYEDVIKDLVSGKLQKYVKKQLSTIYPLRTWEMRFIGLVGTEDKSAEVEEVVKSGDYSADEVVKKLFKVTRERKRRAIQENVDQGTPEKESPKSETEK